jgi:hypothetical protein
MMTAEAHDDLRRDVGQTETVIEELTHDLNLIMAQLAEDRDAWCLRTGRSAMEHAAWRRRALFAKAYKEQELRECKRLRQQRSPGAAAPDRAVVNAGELQTLRALSRRVVTAWTRHVAGQPGEPLANAMNALASCLEDTGSAHLRVHPEQSSTDIALVGAVRRPSR